MWWAPKSKSLEYQFKKQTQHQMQQMPPNASSRCNNSFFFIHLNKYKNYNLSKRCGLSHSFIFFSIHFFKTQSFTLNCIWCRTLSLYSGRKKHQDNWISKFFCLFVFKTFSMCALANLPFSNVIERFSIEKKMSTSSPFLSFVVYRSVVQCSKKNKICWNINFAIFTLFLWLPEKRSFMFLLLTAKLSITSYKKVYLWYCYKFKFRMEWKCN